MAFTRPKYDPAAPLGSEAANTTDDYFREDKVDLNERISLEHQNLETASSTPANVAAQGRHRPGFVQNCFVGTWVAIQALPGVGDPTLPADYVMAYDTTNGRLLIRSGSDWETIQISGGGVEDKDCFYVHFAELAGAVVLDPSATAPVGWKNTLLDTEVYNHGPAAFFALGMIWPKTAGVWSVKGNVSILDDTVFGSVLTNTFFQSGIWRWNNGVGAYQQYSQSEQAKFWGTNPLMSSPTSCHVNVEVGDAILLRAWQNTAGTKTYAYTDSSYAQNFLSGHLVARA